MRKVVIALIVLALASGAYAQTSTPAAPGGSRIQFLPSPTYIPTSTPQPTFASDLNRSEVYWFLATAAANVNALPDDPSRVNGAALLPSDDGRQLFAYAKWAISPQSVREIFGPTLSPIFVSAGVWVVLVIVLTAIYVVVRLVITIIKFIIWVISFIKRLIPFLG